MRLSKFIGIAAILFSCGAISGEYETGMERYFAKDYFGAVDPLRSAAQAGNASAQAILGVMYSGGQGLVKDDVQAAAWTAKAAQQGMPAAQARLGNMYSQGKGVPQDFVQAFQWFENAAQQGNALGQYSVAYAHQYGQGTVQSDHQAAIWYAMAAEQGLAIAQLELGLYYENGKGVSRSAKTAMGWYEKAAVQGLPAAQRLVGIMFITGVEAAPNEALGVTWLRKAAAQGDEAAKSLAGFYSKKIEARAVEEIKACQHRFVADLDDGTSSAGTVASAVLAKCQVPIDSWIRAHFPDATGQGLQNVREGVEDAALKDIAAIVLEFRAALRRQPGAKPRIQAKPRPEA